MSILNFVGVVVAVIVPISFAYWLMYLMREKHASYIHALWLGFSISFVLIFPLSWYADKEKWIGEGGKLVDVGGERVKTLIHLMLDLEGEIKLLAAVIGVIFCIQAIAYLFSGLIGCASSLYMVSRSIGAGMLFFLKSLISAAGFILSVVVNNHIYGWGKDLTDMQWYAVSMANVLVVFSFLILYVYLNFPDDLVKLRRMAIRRAPNLHRVFACIHRKASQYQQRKPRGNDEEDLWEIAARSKNIVERNVREKQAFRQDMRELLGLITETEQYDARQAEAKNAGRPLSPAAGEEGARIGKGKRIDEIRTCWSL